MVGYKAWGAILARRLSQQGVLVASLDYRNYPQVGSHAAACVDMVGLRRAMLCLNRDVRSTAMRGCFVLLMLARL